VTPLPAIEVRREGDQDRQTIRLIHERAFGGNSEARLVDAIRAGGHDTLSLVAVDGNTVVGHILFSPVWIDGGHTRQNGMGLAPMAVHPTAQRRGIGSALVCGGLDRLDAIGCAFVIVVGHAGYYPRFGFEPATRFNIRPQWDGIPDDAFMIRWLPGSAPPLIGGTARYLPEFNAVI
jgi:putative acetyltransferase